MAVEVEAKFLADGAEPLAALAAEGALDDAALGPGRTVDEVDLYLDTADGRLASARWACRLRDRGDGPFLSLKGPAGDDEHAPWLHRRPEVEGAAGASLDPADWPPGEARDLLIQLAGGETLLERLRLVQRRTERAVAIGGTWLGTLSLDVVVVRQGDREVGEPFHLVELELATGDPDALEELERLAQRLADRPGLSPDPRTKLEHALELLGTPSAG